MKSATPNDGGCRRRAPARPVVRGASGLERLLQAVVEDDRAGVRELLKKEPGLAVGLVDEARPYEAKILHWLYVGDSALHLAAAGHRVEIARRLLEAGADPNGSRNHRRSRPLHYAADGCVADAAFDSARQVKTIECLLDAGADIQAVDKNCATALHRAVRTRCAAAVECLLQAGADATARNLPGATPFHLAVQNTGRGGSGSEVARAGQRRIIELMLAHGVSPGIKDARGKSVLDWARSEWVRQLLLAESSAEPIKLT